MESTSMRENIKGGAMKHVLGYLDGNPQENMSKLLAWADMFDRANLFPSQRKAFHSILDDPNGNWYRLIESLWTDIDSDVRKKLFENFFVNASLVGMGRQGKAEKQCGCNVPWAILLDPTSSCNLKCTGCWAADYNHALNLSYETIDDIIRQGKELGTFMYIYSGGKPLVRKKDIIRLCEEHSDCVFLAFTNGTLIDEEFAEEVLRVGNFVPAISVEGFEEATDFRRGKGTYRAVMRAMEILKERKLPFGASCCYTSKNVDSLSSEEYMDHLVACGAKFAWFFHYMPVGNSAVPDLLPSPKQRMMMYDRIRSYRKTKPIFTIDFQNDGEYVKGCIAGGRYYLHINANGDIEPCAFIHYSDSNIHEKSLIEAYQSPLFMAYREGQAFNDNYLRPCPMLENPECLQRMVTESGAHSTDMESPEDVRHLCGKCVEYAGAWSKVADKVWGESHPVEKA